MATIPGLQTTPSADNREREASESRIDSDSHFNGLYQTKQNLCIEGVAEGEIRCDGTMRVAQGARVKAKVAASAVTIAGELAGEVVCQGIFQIMPTGQVQATVSARRLVVHEGGFYNGEFHMITDAPARVSELTHDLSHPRSEEATETPDKGALNADDWWAKLNAVPAVGEPDQTESESGH
jgi:cytoskeletal protein CcmA (bactofilin family)